MGNDEVKVDLIAIQSRTRRYSIDKVGPTTPTNFENVRNERHELDKQRFT